MVEEREMEFRIALMAIIVSVVGMSVMFLTMRALEREEKDEKTVITSETTEAETLQETSETFAESTDAVTVFVYEEMETETETETEPESETETTTETAAATEAAQARIPEISVNGERFALAEYLYNTLKAYGREEYFETVLCQIYQESSFRLDAVSADGLDRGPLQFRAMYWPEYSEPALGYTEDISNPYAQIDVYCWHFDRRLDEGRSLEEAISCHYMSDYGPYSEDYVSEVMGWKQTVAWRDRTVEDDEEEKGEEK